MIIKDDIYKIVCFGDSTTDDDFNPQEDYISYYRNQKVYSQWLQEAVPGILGREVKVINSGISGDTTFDAKLRFKNDVLRYNPDLVIIQFGVNDQCIRHDYGLSQAIVNLDAYCYNTMFFVSRCMLAGASVILMTPGLLLWNDVFRSRFFKKPYDHSDRYGINKNLKLYAEKIRAIAERENLPLVDIFQKQYEYDQQEGCQLEDFLSDGLHPNNMAHEFISKAIIEKIDNIKTKLIGK